MRMAKDELPTRIDVPGARARQQTGFGEPGGYGTFGGEHFTLAAGTDLAPLFRGLSGDLCQSPHWGYLIEGELVVRFQDGGEETARAGDLLYWPPGHTVRASRDSEFVLFSPQHEHGAVFEHLSRQLNA